MGTFTQLPQLEPMNRPRYDSANEHSAAHSRQELITDGSTKGLSRHD